MAGSIRAVRNFGKSSDNFLAHPEERSARRKAAMERCETVLRRALCRSYGEHLLPADCQHVQLDQRGGVRMSRSVEKTALQAASLCGLILCVFVAVWAWQGQGCLTSQGTATGRRGRLRCRRRPAVCGIPGSTGGWCLFFPEGWAVWRECLLLGPVVGFVYNYVGICIGSLMAFAVARHCGKPLLSLLFPEKVIAKYSKWTEENQRFSRLFRTGDLPACCAG